MLGEIVSVNFHKSVINSKASLTYQQAQEVLDKYPTHAINPITITTDKQSDNQLNNKQSINQSNNNNNNKEKPIKYINSLDKSICILNYIAILLYNKRIEAGALTLSSPEIKFNFNTNTNTNTNMNVNSKNKAENENENESSSNPIDVTSYQLRQSNSLVEEMMLLANITVSLL